MLNSTIRPLAAGAMALAIGFAAIPAKAEQFINVLTGGTSGVYYPLGVALSEIYGKNIEGVRTQVQSTKALRSRSTSCAPSRRSTRTTCRSWPARNRASARSRS